MKIKDIVPSKIRSPLKRSEEDNPFLTLRKEMNRLFDSFFDDSSISPFREGWGRTFPQINIKENDKQIEVSAELPGIDQKDADISIYNNVLTIQGEKKQEKEDKEGEYYHRECTYGSFHRDIALPDEVDEDKVKADFKNGILKIILPKKEEAQRKTKKIEIA
ncbi:MAG: Hsp20/alpha crystallin family protein [bacterium]